MSVVALKDYDCEIRDREENFHGNRLTYVHWEDHLSFCSALAFPFPPDMPFGALFGEVMPQFYSMHPDWEKIDWDQAKWTLDGKDFTPDMDKSLGEQGFRHKSLLRFWTPGLKGPADSCS
jgi:phenol hydroxylase P4 protein